MLTDKRSVGVAPEVNLREYVTCKALLSANKSAHCGLEILRTCHQTSNIRASVVPEKGLMSSQNLEKEELLEGYGF